MMMAARVLIVKNMQRGGPGLLRDVLQENQIAADVVELDRGERIPSLDGYAAMFVLGGEASANDTSETIRHELDAIGDALSRNLPYFGVCLGLQLLVKAAGGEVVVAPEPEVGFADATGNTYVNELTDLGRKDPLFQGFADKFSVFQLHGDCVELNGVTQLLATAPSGCRNQIVRVGERAYGVQSHPEVMPEMLAVWKAQDPMLASVDLAQLQAEFARSYEQHARTARGLFGNFLRVAGLVSTIDLTETEMELRDSSVETH